MTSHFSNFQYNLNKICRLFTDLEPSTKIVLYSNISRHDHKKINVEGNSGNKVNKQFCKTNILDLIDNSNMNDQKLAALEKSHLNDAENSLLAKNFIKYFVNM